MEPKLSPAAPVPPPEEWTGLEVAIVGMAGVFPGAAGVEQLWSNLRGGVECITTFTRAELLEAGVPAEMVDDPHYVPAAGHVEGGDLFDAGFFDFTPRDAEILNPQQRVFLERAWEALEHAGVDPARFGRPVGVFAGSSLNTYLVNVMSHPELAAQVGWARVRIANDKDFLATQTSYRLNLGGPSVAVQTACSTSLVAVHLACQSLVSGECDLALAGGASLHVPLKQGYLFQPSGINSPDGHCRAFDAEARGGVGGEGAGVVVLKRLADALAEGDTIHAVVRGSAINNDGSDKAGFTAPSVNGQTRAISEALSVAGVDPSSISYVETHGTGTPLGDAVEVQALHQVFAGRLAPGHRVALGSAKTAVGHLDAAAGVTGLIKATLALSRGEIPPSLNFTRPNPQIEFAAGEFFVNTELRPWTRNGTPRRAGVSSFGIGGTNAHVVLEEAPPREPSDPARELQVIPVSARTASALAVAVERVAAHLEQSTDPLADAAWTLQTGRRAMEHRVAVVARDGAEAAARLRAAAGRAGAPAPRGSVRPVAFLLPGLGMHYAGMGRGLYEAEPVFRQAVDECCDILRPVLGVDLRTVLYPAESAAPSPSANGSTTVGWDLRAMLGRRAPSGDAGSNDRVSSADAHRSADGAVSTAATDTADASIPTVTADTPDGTSSDSAAAGPMGETRLAHPALFVTEYALAKLWVSWGVQPAALLGHSLGEYVAATLAGVFALPDALRLVAERARLIDGLPHGGMLAVAMPEAELRPLLGDSVDVGAVNTPGSAVASGPLDAIEALERELARCGVVARRLPTEHAFHSRWMEPVGEALGRLLEGMELSAPAVPIVSNVTGDWLTDDEARSPGYWRRHLCRTVRFAAGLDTLRATPGQVLLELGPGQTLGAWALQHPAAERPEGRLVVSALRHEHNRVGDEELALDALGRVWAAGASVSWQALHGTARRHRIPLPTYPFERSRYWVSAPAPAPAATPQVHTAEPGSAHGEHTMTNRLQGVDGPPALPARQGEIVARIKRMVKELTGMPEERIDTGIHFLEGGIDSLLLIQAAQRLEKEFGVRLSLVQLLEETSTIDAVAAHLDAVLPPDAVEPAPAVLASAEAPVVTAKDAAAANGNGASNGNGHHPAASNPKTNGHRPAAPRVVQAPPAMYPARPSNAAAPVAEGATALERLIGQQIQLMSQQLEALGGAGARHQIPSDGRYPEAEIEAEAEAIADEAPAAAHQPSAVTTAGQAVARPLTEVVSPSQTAVPQSSRAKFEQEAYVAYRPVNTEAQSGMTAEHREYLHRFIGAYTERTRGSKAHQARYGSVLADSRVTARFRRAWKELIYPIVGDRAAGSRVWDVDGNQYVDAGMGFGCNLFGHAAPFVTRAIAEQVERGYGLTPQSALAGRAAELVCEVGGNDRAVFCNSGSEAIMAAIRAARTFTGRNRVALFVGSYHGWYDGTQVRAAGDGVVPSAPGITPGSVEDVLLLEYDNPASLETLQAHMDELALVMVEPVQSRRPDIQPHAFLRELRRRTEEAGTLLLFDELVTGFRILPGGAQEFFGVRADLVTYGKIVAGGLPMGVVAGRRDVMSVFDGGEWSYGDDSYPTGQRTLFGGAFFKHPISMAVACAVLEEVRRGGRAMYDGLNARAQGLVDRLNAFFEEREAPVAAVNFGSVFRFFFRQDVKYAELFAHHLIQRGVLYLPETGTCFLSLAHSHEDVEAIYQGVCGAVEDMQAGGLLPGGPRGGGRVEPRSAFVIATRATDVERRIHGEGEHPLSAPTVSVSTTTVSPSTTSPQLVLPAGVVAVPLTEGQRQLWIESRMSEGASRAYVESTSLHLHGALDVDALRRALQALVDRHDVLRATFHADGEVQLIHPRVELDVPLVDFTALPAEARDAALRAWVASEAGRAFDLEHGPLVRCAVAAVGDDHHVLAISYHHAIGDGWSFSILVGELSALYGAQASGTPADLPPAPRYADHARRVAARPAAERERADAFWSAQFADGAPVLELPADRPRPPVRGYRGARYERVMDGALVQKLAGPARANGLTLFHVLLSAFGVWLGRLTGQDDVVVGVPSAGQAANASAAGLVGYGINLLPLRLRLDDAQPFPALARAVRRLTLQAVEHQDFSFPALVERLGLRDPARPPLVAAMFNVDGGRGGSAGFTLGDLRVEFENNFSGAAKLDLNVNLREGPAELSLYCDYDTDLFDAATIARWFDAYEALLADVAAHFDAAVGGLDVVPADEAARMAEEWSRGAELDYPADATLTALFEAQVDRTPGATALLHGESSVTYAELDERSNRLARHLKKLGAGPETCVGLCLPRSVDLTVAALAVLKAGAAYLPLDPAHPAERIAFQFADSGAPLVVTRGEFADRLPADGPKLVRLDADARAIARCGATRPERVDDADGLAYVLYTSGSTGTPKGIGGLHRATVNRLAWAWAEHPFAPGEVCCQKTAIGFVDFVWELFGPLLAGVPSVVLEDEDVRDPARLVAALEAHGVTRLVLVPSLLRALLAGDGIRGRLPALAHWTCSGERLPADLCAEFFAQAPGRTLLNLYGSTEVAADVTAQAVSAADLPAVPIGRPIANARVHVLDGRMRPVPAGAAGRVFAGGPVLARGYRGRAAMTAERFVPDPFSAQPGARLYDTGDLARWRADGTLEYLGRADSQVKVRGHRVEPGEVEAALRAVPQVKDAVVVARPAPEGGDELVAYLQPDPRAARDSRTEGMRFGLFYFAADEDDPSVPAGEKYRLYLEGAKFADRNGFSAVWTPERHFHEVAGLYPNPSVLSAALALQTERVDLRAGSVVLPLHNPMRVAEEWAVVDNLSGGRAGLAFASGWVPNDFALSPESFAAKRDVLFDGIGKVRRLWRGEAIRVKDGVGKEVDLRVYPRPVQAEIPVWLTCTGDVSMFRKAGALGLNVLTALLGQSVEQAAEKIAAYREARAAHGHDPEGGSVVMMLHTFVAPTEDEVLGAVRAPFLRYMRAHLELFGTLFESMGVDTRAADEREVDTLLEFAFERYHRTASLMGTPERCEAMVARLAEIGVTEVASLIDFGLPVDVTLQGLEHLAGVMRRVQRPGAGAAVRLREHLSRTLPAYMVPDRFAILPELPRLPSGKVDRRSLPDPSTLDSGAEAPAGFVEPDGPTETELAELWREVLRAPRVGRHDAFFHLGGNSLAAVRLINRVRTRFGVELSVQDLFRAPTLAAMAETLEARLVDGVSDDELAEVLAALPAGVE